MKTFNYYAFLSFLLILNLLDGNPLNQKSTFSCDLENENTLLPITLIGERHHTSISQLLRKKLEKSACLGEIYFVMEGESGKKNGIELIVTCSEDDPQKALLYGLEDENSEAFVAATNGYFYLVRDLRDISEITLEKKLKFILSTTANKITMDAWKIVSENYKHQFKKSTEFINQYINQYEIENDTPVTFIQEKLENFIIDLSALIELSQALAKEVGIKIKENLNFSDEKFECYWNFLNDPNKQNQLKFAELSIEFRDAIMAENLTKLYCEANASGKRIYAMMGKLHLKGVKEYLLKTSKGKIEIEELDISGMNFNNFNPKSEL